jgi:hypothetical protein
MTRELNVDRVLEDWLAEGPSRLSDQAVQQTIAQLDDIPQRRTLPLRGSERMHRLLLTATGLAAVIALVAVALPLFLGRSGLGGPPDGVHFTSERHGYTVVLPDGFRGWTRIERPGTWELGDFFDTSTNSGADDYELRNPTSGPALYVYLSSQPIPTWMTFEDWAAGHDAANRGEAACFEPEAALRTIVVDGEQARSGAWTCPDFADSGDAWTTIQTLVAHNGRGYAIYVWPAEQGDAMPPLAELEAAAADWLSRFSFTD